MAASRSSQISGAVALAALGLVLTACTRKTEAPKPAPATATACQSALEMRVSDALKQLRSMQASSGRARTAIFNLSFPADEAEYRAANRLAVLGMRVFAKNKDDLPIDRAYIAVPGKAARIYALPPIALSDRDKVKEESGEAALLLGPHSQEIFFLAPIPLLRKAGELGIQFKGRKADLPLMSLPMDFRESFILKDSKEVDQNGAPSPSYVTMALATHYCRTSR